MPPPPSSTPCPTLSTRTHPWTLDAQEQQTCETLQLCSFPDSRKHVLNNPWESRCQRDQHLTPFRFPSFFLSPSSLSAFLCLFIRPFPCPLPVSCMPHILGRHILLTMRAKLGSHNMNSTSPFRDPGTVQAFFLHMPGRYYGPQAVTV